MIDVQSVRKRFGPVVALDGVSLSVRPGERVALVGTNGSGKTTLLRALCGLLRVEGRVHLYGEDVARVPQRALARLAYMPQVAPPLEVPVAELVRAHCALRGRTPAQVAAQAGRLGLDLESVARSRVRDLSGGTKQKLLAALALAAEAPVLVCDEPTANLDARTRAAFFEEVQARPADSILVLCSHRVEEVRHLVDRVVELKVGRVERDVPLTQLLSELGAFRMELTFRDVAAAERAAEALSAHDFSRVAANRFLGFFRGTRKVEVVSELVAAYREHLLDVSVLDAESLDDAAPPKRQTGKAP